jgi:hypothetical protein
MTTDHPSGEHTGHATVTGAALNRLAVSAPSMRPSPPAAKPAWTARSSTQTVAARVDSTGRRNTSTVRSCDGDTQTASVGSGGSSTDAFTWSAAGGAA